MIYGELVQYFGFLVVFLLLIGIALYLSYKRQEVKLLGKISHVLSNLDLNSAVISSSNKISQNKHNMSEKDVLEEDIDGQDWVFEEVDANDILSMTHDLNRDNLNSNFKMVGVIKAKEGTADKAANDLKRISKNVED